MFSLNSGIAFQKYTEEQPFRPTESITMTAAVIKEVPVRCHLLMSCVQYLKRERKKSVKIMKVKGEIETFSSTLFYELTAGSSAGNMI